jgi:hypothetical protein
MSLTNQTEVLVIRQTLPLSFAVERNQQYADGLKEFLSLPGRFEQLGSFDGITPHVERLFSWAPYNWAICTDVCHKAFQHERFAEANPHLSASDRAALLLTPIVWPDMPVFSPVNPNSKQYTQGRVDCQMLDLLPLGFTQGLKGVKFSMHRAGYCALYGHFPTGDASHTLHLHASGYPGDREVKGSSVGQRNFNPLFIADEPHLSNRSRDGCAFSCAWKVTSEAFLKYLDKHDPNSPTTLDVGEWYDRHWHRVSRICKLVHPTGPHCRGWDPRWGDHSLLTSLERNFVGVRREATAKRESADP